MPNGTSSSRTFVLLAPALAGVPRAFTRVESNEKQYETRLAQLQRLRGSLYLEDGAIEPWQLTDDGRHATAPDNLSWHLLSMEASEVVGCARLQVYAPTVSFSSLTVAQSALAADAHWGEMLRLSITAELYRAQAEEFRFIEAGGWALAPELRFTTEALHMALASYAIGDLLGGALGLSTATVRHKSSSILRRLGASSFTWGDHSLPPYYDPAYRCEMEVVRFDSRYPNPKYRSLVDTIKTQLPLVQVLCGTAKPETIWKSASAVSNAHEGELNRYLVH